MQVFENPIFWIILFIFQVYLLSILSGKIFNLLYVFLFKIFKKESRVVFVISMLFLPGTFIHELSHAVTATLLGSRVTKFSIWPKVENGVIKMGYAQFIVLDVFRNTLIGISPLLFGIIILYFLIINIFSVNVYLQVFFFYLIFQVANSMFLSDSDIKELKSLILIIIFLITGIYLLDLFFLNLNLFENLNLNLLNFFDLTFLKFLNLFFISTLVINFIFLIIFRLLNKFHRY